MTMYEDLGVAPDASASEIKTAYKRLAQKYHPDRPDGDAVKFLPIQAAYDVLGDAVKRKRYDETGQADNHIFENRVDEKLMQLFNGMLSEENDVIGDAIDQMINMVNKNVADNELHIEHQTRRKAKLEKRMNRVKTKKGHNLYKQLADRQIFECAQTINQIHEEIEVLHEVLQRLVDYEDTDPVIMPTEIQWTTFNKFG